VESLGRIPGPWILNLVDETGAVAGRDCPLRARAARVGQGGCEGVVPPRGRSRLGALQHRSWAGSLPVLAGASASPPHPSPVAAALSERLS
jgi:hypothetical protein